MSLILMKRKFDIQWCKKRESDSKNELSDFFSSKVFFWLSSKKVCVSKIFAVVMKKRALVAT